MKPFRIACPSCEKRLTINKPELVGKRVKCPQCKNPLLIKAPAAAPKSAATPPAVIEESPQPAGLPQIDVEQDDVLAKAQRRRQRRKSGGALKWILMGLFGIASAVAVFAFFQLTRDPAPSAVIPNRPVSQPMANSKSGSVKGVSGSVEDSSFPEKPERGDAYNFDYVPTGARVVLHWKPATLKNNAELWECGGALFPWLNDQLLSATGIASENLEWARCYLIPGPRGEPPLGVFKFKPVASYDLQVWTNEQSAATEQIVGMQVYQREAQRIIWLEDMTGLSVPQSLLEEALNTAGNPLPMTAGLDQLVTQTNSSAELSLLFDLKSVETGLPDWFNRDEQNLIDTLLGWWGDKTEAVLWEVELEEELFFSRMMMQASPFTPTSELNSYWKRNLNELAQVSWDDLRQRALHSEGAQTVLARFPAMLQLASRFTEVDVNRQQVRLETMLLERAAPNLTLASWLYWRERFLPEGATGTPAIATVKESNPQSLVERLRSTLYIDFRLTPLQEAIAQIGEEIQVPFEIDGDALKNQGYTQNMPQDYNLGEVTAEAALSHLLAQYPKMVVVLDESAQKAILTTEAGAAAKNMQPYSFPVKTPPAE
ncbi:MAG: hypothetical protein CMJ46_15025 [Planctomyces sp.]|nr:hypothetical protein [Planctomyces sp.]